MSWKCEILTKSQGNVRFFKIKFNIQRFSFFIHLLFIFSKHLAEVKNKQKSKERPFAILEFAWKMLQKLSSKMLERCPLQYSVVWKSCMAHPKYMANSPQLAVFECSYLLQHLITKKLKSPDSNDTIIQPDYLECQPGLKFQAGRFRKCYYTCKNKFSFT